MQYSYRMSAKRGERQAHGFYVEDAVTEALKTPGNTSNYKYNAANDLEKSDSIMGVHGSVKTVKMRGPQIGRVDMGAPNPILASIKKRNSPSEAYVVGVGIAADGTIDVRQVATAKISDYPDPFFGRATYDELKKSVDELDNLRKENDKDPNNKLYLPYQRSLNKKMVEEYGAHPSGIKFVVRKSNKEKGRSSRTQSYIGNLSKVAKDHPEAIIIHKPKNGKCEIGNSGKCIDTMISMARTTAKSGKSAKPSSRTATRSNRVVTKNK